MLSYFQHQANHVWLFVVRLRISTLKHSYKRWKGQLKLPALPVEILSIIFEIAMEKDNATGAVLCRTSRNFKEIVVKLLYRDVYITSERRATRFLQKLQMDWSNFEDEPILIEGLGIFPILEIRHLHLDCQISSMAANPWGSCTSGWSCLVFRHLRNLRGLWFTNRAGLDRTVLSLYSSPGFTHLGIFIPPCYYVPFPSLTLTHLFIRDSSPPGLSSARYFLSQAFNSLTALTHLIVATRLPDISFQLIHTEVQERVPLTVTHCVFWLSRGENTGGTISLTTATFNDPLTLEYLSGRMNERIMIATTEPWPELPSDEEWTKFVPFWDPSVVDGLSGEFMDNGSMWNEIDCLFAARQRVLGFRP